MAKVINLLMVIKYRNLKSKLSFLVLIIRMYVKAENKNL